MKAINVYFDDEEISKLEKMKGDRSWKEFILDLAGIKAPKDGTLKGK
ncbi:MAG: hypothetical protein KGH64_06310 [Candidatus Micrarchaeota archaeon]|nr:hypothetical protein [Candidatus Micrarchaeota archaeon]